jgi:hypothetical protein
MTMSERPATAADSWREAAECVEQSLAEGDPSLRFLPAVIGFVFTPEYAGKFWAHSQAWGLAISLSPELEGNPCLVVSSAGDWPHYDIELWDRSDQPVVGWFCDGAQELESSLVEALERLQEFEMLQEVSQKTDNSHASATQES